MRKGYISTEHTLWCATANNFGDALPFRARSTVRDPFGCASHYQHAGSAADAMRVGREYGWILTRDFGWLCRACAPAYRKWKESQR
jgi:hypothetical protein